MLTKRIILRQLFPTLAFIIFLSACSGKANNNAVIKAMEESLANSNTAVNNSTQQILKSLEEKTQDPASMERSSIWFPKASQIVKISSEIINYIEGLKEEINSPNSKELFTRLMKYKEDILKVDSSIRNEFNRNIFLVTKSFDSSGKSGNEFWNLFFKKTNSHFASAMLTMIQNNIKNNENRLLAYCYNKTSHLGLGHGYFDYYSAIVGQSSSYVKAGEQIEITAGIGAFSSAAKPKIIINGKSVDIRGEGYGLYKFKASKKAGRHIVPVQISFLNIMTGKEEVLSRNLEYTVAKECDQ